MDQARESLIQYIKTLSLSEEDKQFLVEKISDESLSNDERSKIISEVINRKLDELQEDEKKALTPLFDEAEAELQAAEDEYNATMEDLEKEAQKVVQESSD